MAETDETQTTEEKLPTLEEIIAELPITDEHKQALTNLFTNLATQVVQGNQTIAAMEARINELSSRATEATAKVYEGLSAEQRYNIEMAKAAAPAQAAQSQMISQLLGASRGDTGGLEGLVKSAESLNTLRQFLIPSPTPQQIALEDAQIDQIKAQTRLMNKVTGKKIEDFAAGKGGGE